MYMVCQRLHPISSSLKTARKPCRRGLVSRTEAEEVYNRQLIFVLVFSQENPQNSGVTSGSIHSCQF